MTNKRRVGRSNRAMDAEIESKELREGPPRKGDETCESRNRKEYLAFQE